MARRGGHHGTKVSPFGAVKHTGSAKHGVGVRKGRKYSHR